jgi:hypothetical protein
MQAHVSALTDPVHNTLQACSFVHPASLSIRLLSGPLHQRREARGPTRPPPVRSIAPRVTRGLDTYGSSNCRSL